MIESLEIYLHVRSVIAFSMHFSLMAKIIILSIFATALINSAVASNKSRDTNFYRGVFPFHVKAEVGNNQDPCKEAEKLIAENFIPDPDNSPLLHCSIEASYDSCFKSGGKRLCTIPIIYSSKVHTN
jgi:hypothetical protein